jgi:hypothetical protein
MLLKIEIDTVQHTITVDDLVISLEVLRALVNPDRNLFFRFWRDGDSIVCQSYRIEPCSTQNTAALN